jgi:HTH-type transcriptional regulator / antitoxin HigA
MDYKVIKTRKQYNKAVKRTMELFHSDKGTSDGDELELLLLLVKDYEDKHIKLPELDPIDAIKFKMEELGLKAKDLEPILGTKGHVSSILSGRRELTLKTAIKLKDYLHLPAEVFMHRHAG